jgi:hypothetical protein
VNYHFDPGPLSLPIVLTNRRQFGVFLQSQRRQ